MNSLFRTKLTLPITLLLTLIIACGDSNEALQWQPNVFFDESLYKNRCENPRSGYADVPGTTLFENYWLRSWSNNTYLWYDEIADVNPADYDSAIDYFSLLRSNELTPSGNARDRFHFTFDTEEWRQLSQSGSSAGYGSDFTIISAAPPREILVAYTEPNSPAAEDNIQLSRGAEILQVDGVDVINANSQAEVDTLNAGLFPDSAGESHTFLVRDAATDIPRIITMTSAIITTKPVLDVTTLNTNNTPVGYILFNSHIATSEAELVDAINQLAANNVEELVLDLRYNGGGFLDIAAELAYMIAGESATEGRTFDSLTFNDKHLTTNPVTGNPLSPTPFHKQTLGFSIEAGQALPSLNLQRIFILSTSGTCSASEAIINGLRGVNVEVVLIGDTTCGKPYGFYPTDNCGTTYFTIQFRGANDVDFGDYADGFSPANATDNLGVITPGCAVADDFNTPLGNPQEAQLAAALDFIETGNCPTASYNRNPKRAALMSVHSKDIDPNKPLEIFNPNKIKDLILGLPKQDK